MAFQPVPNVCQVNVRASLLGEQVENVLNFSNPGEAPWTAAGVETLANTVLSAWITNLLPVLGGNYTLREVVATSLEAANAPTFTATPITPPSGGAAGEALPGNVAVVITHKTGISGRSARGRTYLCGITEPQASGNSLTTAAQTAINDAWFNFWDGLRSADNFLLVVQRWSAGVLLPAGFGRVVTSSALRDGVFDSQRRRLPR